MNSVDMVGALHASHTDFEHRQLTRAASAWKRAAGRAWGVVCGTAFLGARASVYVVALACGAVACLAGVALYGLQAVLGGRHG